MDRCIGCQRCSLACSGLVRRQLSWSNAGRHIRSSGGLPLCPQSIRQDKLRECLNSIGMQEAARALPEAGAAVQALRWRLKTATGFKPADVRISKRYSEIVTWKDGIDTAYMQDIKERYTREILRMADQAKPRQ